MMRGERYNSWLLKRGSFLVKQKMRRVVTNHLLTRREEDIINLLCLLYDSWEESQAKEDLIKLFQGTNIWEDFGLKL